MLHTVLKDVAVFVMLFTAIGLYTGVMVWVADLGKKTDKTTELE